jgi:cyanobactin biosynthesis protein (PatB/AcyB/McaB family)
VHRPDLVHPHNTVDVVHGTPRELIAVRLRLLHGANFNDPQAYSYPGMERMKLSTWSAGTRFGF